SLTSLSNRKHMGLFSIVQFNFYMELYDYLLALLIYLFLNRKPQLEIVRSQPLKSPANMIDEYPNSLMVMNLIYRYLIRIIVYPNFLFMYPNVGIHPKISNFMCTCLGIINYFFVSNDNNIYDYLLALLVYQIADVCILFLASLQLEIVRSQQLTSPGYKKTPIIYTLYPNSLFMHVMSNRSIKRMAKNLIYRYLIPILYPNFLFMYPNVGIHPKISNFMCTCLGIINYFFVSNDNNICILRKPRRYDYLLALLQLEIVRSQQLTSPGYKKTPIIYTLYPNSLFMSNRSIKRMAKNLIYRYLLLSFSQHFETPPLYIVYPNFLFMLVYIPKFLILYNKLFFFVSNDNNICILRKSWRYDYLLALLIFPCEGQAYRQVQLEIVRSQQLTSPANMIDEYPNSLFMHVLF
ncbi:hypothetical protein ACJX0J_014832, partial [Zea mays]